MPKMQRPGGHPRARGPDPRQRAWPGGRAEFQDSCRLV